MFGAGCAAGKAAGGFVMDNCPRCGAALRPGQRFCTRCGLFLYAVAPAGGQAGDHAGHPDHAGGQAVVPADELTVPAHTLQTDGRAGALFLWSLVLFFFLNPVGAPLAALAALLCAAGQAEERPSTRALGAARVLCIASTAATGVGILAVVWLLLQRAF